MSTAAAVTPHTEMINDLLRLAVERGVSDVIIKSNKPGYVRLAGKLKPVDMEPITCPEAEAFVVEHVPKIFRPRWDNEGQVDFAYAADGVGRFRVNAFHQRGLVSIVMRHIKSTVPTFEQLGLGQTEQALIKLAQAKDGILLVCGATGSGKSSTMAAMMNWINHNLDKHIVTIEDPIEFRFEDKRSIINQREIGVDVTNFASALRQAMRQSPDVIFIGEMRDAETVSAALSAAETGHLVFSTLHTVNAVQTVERIVSFFPPHQHELLRLQLALNLAGVCSLRLIKNKDGTAMVPAVELMINTPTVRELLEQGQTRQLPKALAEGSYYGTMTFNQSLIRLFQAGNISLEDALAASDNPDDLKMQMRGITQGSMSRPGQP